MQPENDKNSSNSSIKEQLLQFEQYVSQLTLKNNNDNEVAFGISLKSKSVSRSWKRVQVNLTKTLRTILNNTDQNFRIIIAGHNKPNIKEINHEKVTWLCVKFNPPTTSKGFWRDKIQKRGVIGAYLRKSGFNGYFMPVDADDWIHCRFVEYIRSFPLTSSFVFNKGFMVNLSRNEIWTRKHFYKGCGTSQLFYFNNEEFPKSSKRVDVLKSNFKVASGRAHGKVVEYLNKISKQYIFIHDPLIIWVMAHGDNNSIIKGKLDKSVSAKKYNSQGEKIENWLYEFFNVL